MGPNGSGKSTLAYVLAGRSGYEVTEGEIRFKGKNLLEMKPDERAAAGVFLAFQYPIEIPGVATMTFLQDGAQCPAQGARRAGDLDARIHPQAVREVAERLQLRRKCCGAPLNVGFSGGEKKRNEILQMALLEPTLCVMDETDSGLDIDALRVVADGVNALRSPERAAIVITHYQRLLNYIVPDFVHVMSAGRIVSSGGKELALELEEKGYAELCRGGGLRRRDRHERRALHPAHQGRGDRRRRIRSVRERLPGDGAARARRDAAFALFSGQGCRTGGSRRGNTPTSAR